MTPPSGGTTENAYPFAADPVLASQYQQVYSAALFPGPVEIDAITFYPYSTDTAIGTGTWTFSLSTTQKAVDALDTANLDSNLGPDLALFATEALGGYPGQTLTITGAPFVFDPAAGNLLLQITAGPASDGRGGFVAASGDFAGLSSRAYNIGTGSAGYGLVTMFSLTAVPEPSALVLLLTGIAGIAWWARRPCGLRRHTR